MKVNHVVRIEPEEFPKTEVLKIQRSLLALRFNQGAYSRVDTLTVVTQAVADSSQPLARRLWAQALSIDVKNILPQSTFFESGGDSIGFMTLIGLCHENDLVLDSNALFENPTFQNFECLPSTECRFVDAGSV